ncbi:glycoside hydrolase family 2 TIM barrel-domain containing protein [Hyunsoonleella rubra]|uniref:Glycoside hydrolase family 2 TIM barrel-domain containing protein n=1 Tax=Hyunsoonleella rubra TaxID=1737062 RepID=A0ABW5T944_9FLAO
MKNNLLRLVFLLLTSSLFAQANKVEIVKNDQGTKLVVDGKDFMMNGINWDYVPIGTDVTNANFWELSDDVIKAGLDTEMGLLKNMNVNVVRQYVGVPAKWVTYIYEKYGIYTLLNHSFGRYGLTLDGVWTPVTIYTDEKTQEQLVSDMMKLVEDYKDVPGILMYMMGNENNYGLFWAGNETEDFPEGEEQKRAVGEKRGRPMYRLMNDVAKKMKEMDPHHPVAICNGDVLFIDIIAEECKDVDVYGANTYRGESFGDFFQVVKDKLDKPVMFTEFGADAYNALADKEDQYWQAHYNLLNWKEIYENAAGMGKVGNSIGGFTFQFSDGWWKLGFDDREGADTHETGASWSNGGYYHDTKDGSNNMNEEWFGICAKGPTDARGLYDLYPRASYYTLKEAHALDPYGEGMNLEFLQNYFKNINIMDAVLKARGDKAALNTSDMDRLSISRLSAKFTTFSTGGTLITTPETADPDDALTFPNELGFDHMQSYFVGIQGKPASNMTVNVDVNVLGNVASNPINEIFYENVGRPVAVTNVQGEQVTLTDNNRVRVYQAEFDWKAKDFDLRGFYRTGHYHWAYEGDFFNLYPEANYGPNLDIYNGEILGFEVDAKGELEGLKAAFGPQLWWGANPTMLLKYSTHIAKWDVTGIYHRDINTDLEFDDNGRRVLNQNQVRSGIIPAWPTERATIAMEREFGKLGLTLGAIWGGRPLNGSSFQVYEDGADVVLVDKINSNDNWGTKGKITYQNGPFNWYAQGSYMGLVANGGVDQTRTFTGWRLKDSGSGNMTNFLTGLTFSVGDLQIAPNFMWQKPLVDPMPNGGPAPGRLRNVIDDPFAVRNGNRETSAGEILLTYDPTPGTWMYAWDNDRAEDAKLALSAGFVYRHLPTTMDGHIGFLADRTFFAFGETAPAVDLWEAHAKVMSKMGNDFGLIGNFYYGNGQGNGDSDRTITRFGADLRVLMDKIKIMSHFKVNDWGPFDYHRDFNLTYPLQLMLDVSTTLGKPDWFILPSTQIGIRGMWRSLDANSPRYSPLATDPNSTNPNSPPILSPVGFPDGSEWEIRTYIHINIGR